MSKVCEKRVHGNGGTTLPWALKECPRSLYFTLLSGNKISDEPFLHRTKLLVQGIQKDYSEASILFLQIIYWGAPKVLLC